LTQEKLAYESEYAIIALTTEYNPDEGDVRYRLAVAEDEMKL
jgi:hypothetical protein